MDEIWMRNQYSMGIRGKTGVSSMALGKRCRIRLLKRKGDLGISVKKRAGTLLYDTVSQSAGTGYGREGCFPSGRGSVEPEASADESVPSKYEWRTTLCRMNVITCGQQCGRTHNRFWDSYVFAPVAGETVMLLKTKCAMMRHLKAGPETAPPGHLRNPMVDPIPLQP
jgi:hypothetical protein